MSKQLKLTLCALVILVQGSCSPDNRMLDVQMVSPSEGAPSGGTRVVLQGNLLDTVARVTFGEADCTNIERVSDIELRCTTPQNALGAADVTVFTEDGESATLDDGFRYRCLAPPAAGVDVWANDGGDKITRDEQRFGCDPGATLNKVWDGGRIRLSAAKNETVSFNLVIEAYGNDATGLSASMTDLAGPGGSRIGSVPAAGNGIFDWTQRRIELFYVRYLQIKGLSRVSYATYDERHVPKRLQRPYDGQGYGRGTWEDRPDHDKFYPDIAVPLELVPEFTVRAGQNQSIWVDVYVPKTAAAGLHTGVIRVQTSTATLAEVPVELTVRGFALPDVPASKTMLYMGYADLSRRYLGVQSPNSNTAFEQRLNRVRDRHFQMAHRHRISMVDDNQGALAWTTDAPRPEWIKRLDGTLFTAANGYDGPGVGVGNDIFSIGNYGNWSWRSQGEAEMRLHTDAWETWFQQNFPSTERFLYLIDESENYPQTQQWAQWIRNNPGVGGQLRSFATLPLPIALGQTPSLDIVASWQQGVGDTATWANGLAQLRQDPRKKFYMYNGKRPGTGSFATEDDGVALRQLPWAQYKKGVDRWFFWESTYYNDFQSGRGHINVYQTAQTFGVNGARDAEDGETGYLYSNGDGVLFYPGYDTIYESDNYGVDGPIASLRLKHWRRGIQDVDYLELARTIDPARTQAIINRMVPRVMWENGVADQSDPTWVRKDIGWSINPDDWEAARDELAAIIEGN
jgi:hypothetical protein